MSKDEIVTALRCCDGGEYDECYKCPMRDGINCRNLLDLAAADLIEKQQREIEALRQADEGLRLKLTVQESDEIYRAALETFGARAQVWICSEGSGETGEG